MTAPTPDENPKRFPLDPWSEESMTAHHETRAAWEATQGDARCPNCEHLIREHCSRNLTTRENGCCPGYCFAIDDDPGCKCPGYVVEKVAT